MGTKHAVLEAALKLPAEDRAELAEVLIGSLDDTDADVESAWVAEVKRRMTEEGDRNAFLKPEDIEAEVKKILGR